MRIDAHCHTDCSDGSLSIEGRMELVRRSGLSAATITDHDFVSRAQVERARRAAGGIPYIAGLELSLGDEGQVVHVLGYFVDPENPSLQDHIREVSARDRECATRLLDAARRRGSRLSLDELQSPALHTYWVMRLVKALARELFADDPAKMQPYFLGILQETGLTWAALNPWSVREGIDLIHAAGGIAVLAHPGGEAEQSMRALGFALHDETRVRRYIDWGVDGLEVWTPVHTAREKERYGMMCARYELLATAGSDCHGDDPYLGPATMGVFNELPEDLYERMVSRHDRRNRG